MTNPRFSLAKNWFSKYHRLLLILFSGLLTVLFAFFLYLQLFSKESVFKESTFKITSADISFKPTIFDSLGVDPLSKFILSSKSPLNIAEIKEKLKVRPALAFDVEKINKEKFKISFTRPLEDDNIYRFQLTTADKDLSWAFQIKSTFRIVQNLPKNQATGVPLNSGIEITFSHDDYKDIASFFEINPKVAGRFERHKRTAVFVPEKLQPATLYTVKVKKGLALEGSNEVLKDNYVFQFETETSSRPKITNKIGFIREMSEYPNTEKPAFNIFLSDSNAPLPTLSIDVFQFKDISQLIEYLKQRDQIPIWARYSRETYRQDTRKLAKVLSFKAPIQKIQYSGYFVFPQTLPDGYYLVEAKSDEQTLQTWLQITDIATYLSTSSSKTLAWINDVSSQAPIVNASVQLIDSYSVNQKTDKEGVVFFDTPDELIDSKTKRYFKVSTQSGRSSIVPVVYTNQFVGYGGGWFDEKPVDRSDYYWTYLYLDRPIYLPTDSVQYWGMVRDRDSSKPGSNLKLILTRSDYYNYYYEPISILEKDIQTSDTGTFIGEFPLTNFQTGFYRLEIKQSDETVISNGFSIETYSKPAYKIELETDKKAVFAGEKVEFIGRVSFFEGTPVSGVRLKYTGSTQGEVTSDSKGAFKIIYQPQYTEESTYSRTDPRYHSVRITPLLAEEGEIEGGANVLIFGPNISVKTNSEVSEDTGIVKITLNHIILDRLNNGIAKDNSDYLGKPAASQEISGKFYENHWEKQEVGQYYDFINKVERKRYQYKNVKKFLKDVSLTTNDKGQAVYRFLIDQDKYYQLELVAIDNQGRKAKATSYLYGKHGTEAQKSAYYYLKTEKTDSKNPQSAPDFSVGEEVVLTLQKDQEDLPGGENNRYLFRLAQRGIRDFRVQEDPVFKFNFAAGYVPNVVAKAVYFNGKTFFESSSLSLPFKKDDKKLTIDVNTDKASYKPRDKVNLDVFVKDKEGRGQEAEVNISLVDEALFKLADQHVDTLNSLYRSVSSGVIQSYASHQYPLEIEQLGGAGGCFLTGTKILVQASREKNIEDIKAGDFILTRQAPNSSRLVKAKVTKTFKHIVDSYLLVNNILRVTPEHILFINGGWMAAGNLKLGDYLLDDINNWTAVTSIEQKRGKFKVYNLEVEKYKTFFADDFYVHNQKGRILFTDRAFFSKVKTDVSGRGQISFDLPDNLTSWRITHQAIGNDLSAGSSTKLLPVKLPFFVDTVLAKEYLVDDKPIIKLRSFGEKLKEGQEVEFTVEGQKLTAKAFEETSFPLSNLSEGEKQITIKAKSSDLEDIVTRKVKVMRTRLSKTEAEFYSLLPDLKIRGSRDLPTTLVFSDENRGRFYWFLTKLAYTYGDRLDQKLTRIKSQEILKEFFNENSFSKEELNPPNYQTREGGLSLFPYSDNDLALSAKAASLAKNLFDQQALRQYFYKILDDSKEGLERTVMALYGLASLEEPVLVPINNLLQKNDLAVKDQLYLGLAAAQLGAKDAGRTVVKSVLEQFGEERKPLVMVKTGKDQDDSLQATALAADLASLVDEERQEGLFRYITENKTKDILVFLEQLFYLVHVLPKTAGEPVQFTYLLDGQEATKTLEKGEVFKLQLSPKEVSQISFSDIRGNVGLTSFFEIPFDVDQVGKDTSISIKRNYSIKEQITNQINEADLVKVMLDYQLADQAFDGCYQVTDLLPSGLRAVSRPYSYGIKDENVWYPYEVTDQKISFCVNKGSYKPIVYYARVISTGDYKAEGTLIQSLKSVNSFNLSNSSQITIR